MLSYLICGGRLPWMGQSGSNSKEKLEKVREIKKNTTPEELFPDKPMEFVWFLRYCRELKFEKKPNYEMCKGFFHDLLVREGFSPEDKDYDWLIKR